MNQTRLNKLYLYEILTVLVGCLLGLVLAYFFSGINWDFSKELQRAEELGIVSQTVLAGYPKTKDIITYATVLLPPIIFSIGLWLLFVWNKQRGLYGALSFSAEP
ncbi:MAG: hypothetical protein MUO88_16340, partial [Desulfobacterales bacterium]|nr:hypothetical protein [Desulfobacterales bacterium]